MPVVSVYNAAGTYQAEVVGNPADDGAANVPVTVTGTYFALVRPSNGTGGIDDQYVLDVQIVPTGSLNFPNLVVSSVVPPAGSGILSGQTVKYSYTVLNSGNTPTPAPNWIDRVVLSTDPILGNADDVSLGFFPHSGVLAPGASYNATNSLVIPDGLSGDFYVVVQADAGNAINELLFEGDNTTSSGATFHVDVAPYPDVSVENLVVSAPDANHQYTVTWKTANHGTAAAPSGFVERLVVVNQTTGVTLKNVNLPLAVGVPINGAVAHSQTVTATDAGNYLVTVVTDSGDALFEYNGAGHVSAESNNTATAQFGITVNFNVTVASSPVGAGTLTGAGSYASGTPVTVVATPNTNDLPYLFVNWTEGGAFQSGTSNYAFVIGRDRTLTANFTLPSFVVSVANNPVAAGSVTGQGTYFYGFTNILSATANFGYRFTNWTENGSVVGTTPLLTNIVKKNRTLVANYVEANTVHTVVTGTFPTNVTTVAGAGNYNNGQTADVVAPLSVTNAPNVYTFREFRVNGTLAGTSTTVHKLFSTVDPTNLVFVAYYDSISIKPLVTNLLSNIPGTIPATTNFILGIQFNRGMNTNVAPGISLTNPAAGATQASVPAGGTWSTTVNPNDTFTLKPITFSAGMDGTNRVRVSLAKDLNGSILDPTNVVELLVDVTPPLNPTVSLISSNSVSATVSWVTYLAPADINGFRLYIAPTNFSSVSSLVAVSSVASATRTFTYTGLNLDTDYYVAATAVDAAGNSASTVVPLKVRLPSTVPPPVAVNVAAASSSSATVSWTGYNTGNLFGFAGFRLYYETTDFNTVTGHSIRQSLAPDVRTFTVEGLDRTKTYHFAVVGYNGTNGFNATVATGSWSDPYAGVIASDTTLGGGGETTVDVLHDISIQNNAVLTIPAGTTVRFAAGTGITVQQGVIHADGTALDPVVFTSIRDQAGQSSAPGDWKGIGFTGASGATLLRHVFVKYGGGLLVTNASFTLDAFSALYNNTVGLGLFNGAALNTTNALLAYNGIGAEQSGASHLTLRNSVIKNNDTNAFSTGGSSIVGQANWWGSAVAGDITALNVGAVDTSNFLTTEPILTPAIGIVGNVTQVSTSTVDLRLASRTADAMRVSEDSTFAGVFFTPFSNSLAFALSDGGGHKSIYAQFRSVTGATNPPVAVAVEYVTQGPTITAYSLEEGDSLTRPLRVTGTSTAPLGIIGMSLNVDGTQVATNAAGSFSTWLDIRGYTAGIHRVELVARDNGGAIARSGVNVTISPNPPSAPVIVVPIDHKVVNTPTIVVSGTAEPFLGVRIVRASVVLATGTADAAGNWSFPAVPLADGNNALAAVAFDTLGSASSPVITVSLNTGPPVAVVQDLPFYNPTDGLSLSWHYPTNGTAANRFRVFWNQAPFSSTNGVVGSSPVLTGLTYKLPTIPAGFYYFAVVGYDEAGNASALSNLQPFAYDPFPPAFAIGFDKASPVGVGPVHITLTASKALSAPPSLTLKWPSTAPVALSVVNTSLNTYEATLNVTPFTASGLIDFTVSAQDLLGNVFQGAPTGVPMVVDVVLPTGRIATSPLSPIQTTNSTNVSVSLTLSKPAKAGTVPQLTFAPPTGSVVPLTVTGAGTNWSTTLPLTPAMGSGFGAFALTVSDQLDNVGQVITTGGFLEIYNTAKPSAPAAPTIFEVASVPGGGIKLAWTPITNAEIYRVYSKPGTNGTPVDLVTDGLTDTVYTNFPPADGYYRIAVTASRRGAEGTNSNIIIGLADSTPPPAPTNLVTELAASGVDIKWQRGEGKAAFTYRLYRNDVLIQTIAGSAETNYFTTDSPPRGTMVYRVGALDQIGNEALSDTSTIQLLVGAVNQFTVLATEGQAPYLTWTSTDPTAVGFNIYRDGIKQNSTPIPAAAYLDSLGIPKGGQVSYVVKAVNSTNAESAARRVTASSLAFSLGVNVVNGTNQALIQRYFDDYRVTVSNLTSATSVGLDHLELVRTVATGDTLTRTDADGVSIGAGNYLSRDVVFPGSLLNGAQSVMVRAIQAPDIGGSKVIYQRPFDFGTVNPPTSMIDISAAQPPLAGGLASLNLRIYNRGYAAMDLLVARDGGSSPSDLGISLINQFGQEVGHAGYKAIPPGAIFAADGRVFLRVSPGQSTQLQVTNILVPESLGTNGLFFQATFPQIYYDLGGTKEVAGGPLQGGMISSLAVTPYFGTATTDHQFYANDDPVIITGAAVDRVTQNPVPNVPLKIGFSISGTKFYQDITTDGTGHYSFAYNPPQGLSGTIKLWAAHPAVFDILNQAQVTIYRVYMSPGQVDLRMSKNDHLDFSVGLINPGDATLSGFQLETDVFRMEGTNLIPITTLTATADVAPDFIAGPKAVRQVKFRLQAALDAPDNAVVHFRLRSAEGAIAELSANVMLLPAQPLLAVIDPTVGYAEVSVNRGNLVSKTVTIANKGLRDLQGVTLSQPTNINWITVNLPTGPDGKIHLPDMAVGATNQFTVVFAPPASIDLDFYQDQFVIAGTNADATFPVGVYALVTSSVKGDVKFYVDDILVQAVPNATIRIKNTLINEERIAQTDLNGFVTITNLQEGHWAWQVGAPGYSTTVGVADVVGGQTIMQETRLSKSLVTVNFTVVPVPFTDRYEITIEQTFETHVPAPVLVLTPPNMDFRSVGPGYDATFLVTAKNYGLIQMTDLKIEGMTDVKGGTLTPLITYVPLMRAQESIVIPFHFTYQSNGDTGGDGGVGVHSIKTGRKFDGGGFADCATGGLGGLADFVSGLMAFANAHAQCVDARAAMAILASLAVTYSLLCAPSFSPLGLLPSPCPSGGPVGWIISFFINALSCFCQNSSGGCFGGGDDGGGNGPGGPDKPVFTKYGGGGPECFEAGTQVLLADGSVKLIEQVQAGDRVRTGSREEDIATVGSVESHVVNGVYQLQFGGGRLNVTGEHLIWLDGHGWTAARNVQAGDWLMGATGQRVQVTGTVREPRQTTVYTFTNMGDHAFIANGMLVHDQCGQPAQLTAAKPGQNQ
ncbi:MAG TPA: fibronectin type III domain-containing protein [Candidatus Limnocylindria bacterium]|nr:fibronectin type III domain-containing protein [Candidatus Limnocylindria bacterium]